MARMRNLPAALAWVLAVVIAYLERRDPVRRHSAALAQAPQTPARERTPAEVPPPPETESATPSPTPRGERAALLSAAEPTPGTVHQPAPSAAEPIAEPSSDTDEPIAGPDAPIASPDPVAQAVPTGAVAGDGTHACPPDFPIKGNASSMIYHQPGQPSYDRTVPEFCFASEHDAEAAGYRPPKR